MMSETLRISLRSRLCEAVMTRVQKVPVDPAQLLIVLTSQVFLEDFLSSRTSSQFIPTLLTGGHVTCWAGLPVSSSFCNSDLDHLIDLAIDVSLQEFSWPAQKLAGQRK